MIFKESAQFIFMSELRSIYIYILQTLLYGERFQCNVGKSPENIPKNRFKKTFPCMYIF